ncbi:MAG TPA: peptide-methionine (S)-S-oxide reductase MsrA [Opitutaceae bacterium]|nr:peptide-methionine (S)-S-oxide reductase MsrA [Opitutaceae bacterium]
MKIFLYAFLMALFTTAASQSAAAKNPTSDGAKTETIVLGGGCFWCTEAAYHLMPGVKSVVSGYAGGSVANPTYEQVCSHDTGHAEVVKVEFDPQEVSLDQVLDFFWTIHDPTTLNRQGNDEGPQYRSTIMYANDAQKDAAEKSKAKAQAKFSDPIVTEIVPLKTFYAAEAYHQNYYKKNPYAGYCQYVIKPKIKKAEKTLSAAH